MICFPNAKINIGLRVIGKRPDGYHNIESIFYPVNWYDALEVKKTKGYGSIKINLAGIPIPDKSNNNLCVKLYKALLKEYKLPSIEAWLLKTIPIGAGLGGGSADAACFIKALNTLCNLGMSAKKMKQYVSTLGSDCAFFIDNKPVIAAGKGERMSAMNIDLSKYYITIVYSGIVINTSFAYSLIAADNKGESLKSVITTIPVKGWKNKVSNDFETPIMKKHPVIKRIKNVLYKQGAVYASMTGSGSAVYGLFVKKVDLKKCFPSYKVWSGNLKLSQ